MRDSIENKMYGNPRAYEPPAACQCGLSSVDPTAKIMINGIEHAGIVTHVCAELPHGVALPCICACGASWPRNVK